jgi:glycerol-3-phosphate dehydrogenase
MVERDWSSGTSSRSSKLVHGGIRYLEQLDFDSFVRHSSSGAFCFQRLAPHLVKPAFFYPLKSAIERLYIGAGMLLYDIFSYSGGRPPGVPHHRHLQDAGDALHPEPLQRRADRGHHLLRRPG